MLNKIVISVLGLMTLAMCKSQQKKEVQDAPDQTSASSNTNVLSEDVRPSASNQTNNNIDQSQTIYLKEGENIFLKGHELNVTFLKIIEDSRCPEGVNCIWEGVATAEIELMGVSTRPRVYKISTTDNETKGYKKTIIFNGKKISLSEITPYPTASQDQKSMQGKYKIGLSIISDKENTTTK